MAATEALAKLIAETPYESIPREAVEAAKAVVLDGIGVMLAGSLEEPARIVADYVRDMGGNSQCTVYGHGFSTSPVMAAFANGVAGHVLDFEPMWHPTTHPTSPVLPPILALAELRGDSISGRDFLAALIVGFEVQGRIRMASAQMDLHGFHPPGLVGVMGSAAASSRLLALGPGATRMALAISASRAGALAANIGTMTKSTHCGNAGRMGLESALLAARGLTGNDEIMEHPLGYANVLFGEGFDLGAVTHNFGNPYRLVDPGVAIKKHPSQYGTHRGIDAALELRDQHGIRPETITGVTIEAPVMPYVSRPYPRTGLEGKFSFQYTVALALLDGAVNIGSFTDDRRFAQDMADMLGKIELRMDPDIPANFEGMWTSVEVRLADGRSYTARCDRPRGIWGSPLTQEERLAKYRSCASLALSEEAVERCVQVVEELDLAPGLQELIDLLRTARAAPT